MSVVGRGYFASGRWWSGGLVSYAPVPRPEMSTARGFLGVRTRRECANAGHVSIHPNGVLRGSYSGIMYSSLGRTGMQPLVYTPGVAENGKLRTFSRPSYIHPCGADRDCRRIVRRSFVRLLCSGPSYRTTVPARTSNCWTSCTTLRNRHAVSGHPSFGRTRGRGCLPNRPTHG